MSLALARLALLVLGLPFTLIGLVLRNFVFGRLGCKLIFFVQSKSAFLKARCGADPLAHRSQYHGIRMDFAGPGDPALLRHLSSVDGRSMEDQGAHETDPRGHLGHIAALIQSRGHSIRRAAVRDSR